MSLDWVTKIDKYFKNLKTQGLGHTSPLLAWMSAY